MPPIRIKERGRAKKGTMKRLVTTLFKKFPGELIICIVCLVFNVLANLCSSVFAGLVTSVLTASIEEGVATGTHMSNPFVGSYQATAFGGFQINTNVTVLLIAMGSIYLVGIFAAWFWTRTMAIVTQKFMNEMRKAMFNHMEDLPIRYFDQHPHGEIMSLYTNDVDTIRQFISQALPEFIRTGLSVIFSLVMMLVTSIWMTLVVLVGAFCMLMSTKIIGGRASKYFIKQQKQMAKVEGNIEESINGLKVIKVFTHEEESIAQFNEMDSLLKEYSTEANIHGNVTAPINGNLSNLMYVGAAILAILLFVFNKTNVSLTGVTVFSAENKDVFYSSIVAFLMMTRMFGNNINQFSQQVTFIVMGMAGASRCFDLLDEQKEVDNGYVTLVNIKYNDDGSFVETNEKTRYYI